MASLFFMGDIAIFTKLCIIQIKMAWQPLVVLLAVILALLFQSIWLPWVFELFKGMHHYGYYLLPCHKLK